MLFEAANKGPLPKQLYEQARDQALQWHKQLCNEIHSKLPAGASCEDLVNVILHTSSSILDAFEVHSLSHDMENSSADAHSTFRDKISEVVREFSSMAASAVHNLPTPAAAGSVRERCCSRSFDSATL